MSAEYSNHHRPFAPLDPVVARVAKTWFELPDGWEQKACATTPVGLLIGEQPGPGSNPRLPLWPYPPGSSGGRLHRMTGVPVADYLTLLARVNLFHRPIARWTVESARARMASLLSGLPDEARVVLVGTRVRDAYTPSWSRTRVPLRWFEPIYEAGPCVRLVAIPHPSGRNPDYNHADTRARAGAAVRWAAGIEE